MIDAVPKRPAPAAPVGVGPTSSKPRSLTRAGAAIGIEPDSTEPNGRSFEEEASAVASCLRAAVAALIGALPGKITGGTDLDRELKLGSTVSWRLHSFASAANPIASLQFLPGRASISKLTQAARRRGINENLTLRVMEAYERFERFQKEHAGDRATLAALVGGAAGEDGGAQIARRRAAFMSNAELWGVRATTCVRCVIWHPGESSSLDSAMLAGFVGAHALRRGVPVRIAWATGVSIADKFDETLASTDHGILRDFCTQPLPAITIAPDPSGKKLVTKVIANGVGKANAIDFFVWDRTRGDEPDTSNFRAAATMMTLPVESFLVDTLVPRGTADTRSVSLGVFANPTNVVAAYAVDEGDRLPTNETPAYLGADLDALQCAEVANYPALVREVLERTGWSNTEFDLFRCRVPYPVLHSVVQLSVKLREG